MPIATERLHPDRRAELQRLISSVEQRDGTKPLSENKAMRLGGAIDTRERVAIAKDGSLVGYGQAAWHRGDTDATGYWALEVVVAERFRTEETVGGLVEALRVETGSGDTTLWARSEYVSAVAVASGWYQERVLWEMTRPLPIADLAADFVGFDLATFRIGVDEGAWLGANNAAFAGHPENGRMTRRDLELRMAQSWFDPSGFFLAWANGELAGSCWTKIHDDGAGEIYIIGVVPAWEGRGLGRDLVSHGLKYLGEERHLNRAVLFVEASNGRAVALYQDLGFEKVRELVAYRYPPKT